MTNQTKTTKCEFCGRTLSDPESLAAGIGPECAAKKTEQLSAVNAAVATVDAGQGSSRLTELVNRLKRLNVRISEAMQMGDVSTVARFTNFRNDVLRQVARAS